MASGGLNPVLAQYALFSWANRGGNFWIRPTGDVPKLTELWRYNTAGEREHLGEWRWKGNYTIIHGTHETWKPYQTNGKTPLELDWTEIQWPKGVHPFNPEIGDENFTEIQRHRDAESTELTDDVVSPLSSKGVATLFPSVITSVVEAVAATTPTEPRSSDARMFQFCRAPKKPRTSSWSQAHAPRIQRSIRNLAQGGPSISPQGAELREIPFQVYAQTQIRKASVRGEGSIEQSNGEGEHLPSTQRGRAVPRPRHSAPYLALLLPSVGDREQAVLPIESAGRATVGGQG